MKVNFEVLLTIPGVPREAKIRFTEFELTQKLKKIANPFRRQPRKMDLKLFCTLSVLSQASLFSNPSRCFLTLKIRCHDTSHQFSADMSATALINYLNLAQPDKDKRDVNYTMLIYEILKYNAAEWYNFLFSMELYSRTPVK
jgi:hypothetical protein